MGYRLSLTDAAHQFVRVDLTEEPWVLMAITSRVVRESSQRLYHYRYGTAPPYCFVTGIGMQSYDLIGHVAEVRIERDGGGPVVTAYRVVRGPNGERQVGVYPMLSTLIW
jgi:hypothetical protein